MPLNELVEKTERAVETAFLWLRILKALKCKPMCTSELRRSLKPMPHRPTMEASLFLMSGLGLVERVGQGRVKPWRLTRKGEEILERAGEHLKKQLRLLLES
ncbi:hypothetical protein KEJ37_00270 [Candidatus Bathyarchaeota archaeon]|nr:hypothetical protein [Candidatus Bathyarchaeota archaeon]